MSEIAFRPLTQEDIPAANALVMHVARSFIWEELTEQGRRVFSGFCSVEAIRVRQRSTTFYGQMAWDSAQPVGVIELRGWSHISLLFVDTDYHKRGIGRALIQGALEACHQNAPFITRVTVGASLYGVPFYEKMGFVSSGPRKQENGITYKPMFIDLSSVFWKGDGQHQIT